MMLQIVKMLQKFWDNRRVTSIVIGHISDTLLYRIQEEHTEAWVPVNTSLETRIATTRVTSVACETTGSVATIQSAVAKKINI